MVKRKRKPGTSDSPKGRTYPGALPADVGDAYQPDARLVRGEGSRTIEEVVREMDGRPTTHPLGNLPDPYEVKPCE